ncbi:hypothetical protein [Albidovulum sp.]|uniref:hypothetical protein n=1 Tax=Albidovulum sp. TaxID=1872424 RepID=UPI0039B891DB
MLIEQRKADSWSVCAHCDCGLDARPIRDIDGELRACCPNDASEDVILREDDLRRFLVDPDRLAAQIAASGDIGGAAARIAEGIWLLGNTSSGHAIALCLDPDELNSPGMIMAIKGAAGPQPLVLIACAFPTEISIRLRETGIEPRQLADVFRATPDGTGCLVLDKVPTPGATPRLVLDRAAQSAILDGVRLDLPMQMFALFRLLTEQAAKRDPLLKKQEIETQTSRPANEIVRDLRKALAASGLPEAQAKALIATVRARGYRLGLEPAEISIEG